MLGAEIVFHYFPDLSKNQKQHIEALFLLYKEWNAKINVISRKDIEELYIRHVLHSLSIAKFITLNPGADILDVGTGGGFPGIPLAIFFPETKFLLVDSIGKKIKVVQEISSELGLKNLTYTQERAEKVSKSCDFVVSRAVANATLLYQWTHQKIKKEDSHQVENGFLFLKGGDVREEMRKLGKPYQETSIWKYFQHDFFEAKKIIYIPRPLQ